MTASLIPVSSGSPMTFTKSEATAGNRTWCFYLSNTADGSAATGKTISGSDFRISKDGAAFGNATGTVTEMSLGWYKMVFAQGDVDTEGALACELSVESGVDPLRVVHQVISFDRHQAKVTPADDSITAAVLAASADSELQSGMATSAQIAALTLATKTVNVALGTITGDGHVNSAGDVVAISMLDALDATVTLSGVFGSASCSVQVCEDPSAASPVWTAYDDSGGTNKNPLTAAGAVKVLGPHSALRIVTTSSTGSTAVAAVVAIRKPAGA